MLNLIKKSNSQFKIINNKNKLCTMIEFSLDVNDCLQRTANLECEM